MRSVYEERFAEAVTQLREEEGKRREREERKRREKEERKRREVGNVLTKLARDLAI